MLTAFEHQALAYRCTEVKPYSAHSSEPQPPIYKGFANSAIQVQVGLSLIGSIYILKLSVKKQWFEQV